MDVFYRADISCIFMDVTVSYLCCFAVMLNSCASDFSVVSVFFLSSKHLLCLSGCSHVIVTGVVNVLAADYCLSVGSLKQVRTKVIFS